MNLCSGVAKIKPFAFFGLQSFELFRSFIVLTVLAFARLAGIHIDDLVDDEVDLSRVGNGAPQIKFLLESVWAWTVLRNSYRI